MIGIWCQLNSMNKIQICSQCTLIDLLIKGIIVYIHMHDMTYKDYCKRYGWIPPIAKLLKRALLSYQVAEKFTDPHWENYWDPFMVLSCSVNLYDFLGFFFYYLGISRIHQTLQKNKLLTWLEQLIGFAVCINCLNPIHMNSWEIGSSHRFLQGMSRNETHIQEALDFIL